MRSSTLDAVQYPEALRYLVGDKLDQTLRRDLKVSTYRSYLALDLALMACLSISCFGIRFLRF